VGFQECERVSRDLSAALDVANPIPHAYRLEVSSPGIDRPLRRERDFARFAGSAAKIKTTEAVEGRRNFQGVIRGAEDGVVDVECDGRSYQLPLDAIARANLVPDWAAEFRRAGGQRAPLDDRREGGAGDSSRGAPADSTNRSAS
jgi:ribosome maturation factor RimP